MRGNGKRTKLRILRENSNLTQKQVAAALHVDRSTYAYYESGAITPSLKMLFNISKVFDVPITDLFEVEEKGQQKNVSTRMLRDPSIYDLEEDEQALILHYRMLSPEEKEAVAKSIIKNDKSVRKKSKKEDESYNRLKG